MWKSLCGSPDIKIYHDGSRFRLQFIYKHDTAFTVPLKQSWGITFFYFYGIIRIAYDDEQDMLDLVAVGLSSTSRLCCQIIVAEELDGLVVTLPGSRQM